jgi:thioredoxin reductase
MHDLLIVGSGSAGVAAAIEASNQGASVAVIEPGKANHKANGSSFAGVKPRGSELDFKAIIGQKTELVEDL